MLKESQRDPNKSPNSLQALKALSGNFFGPCLTLRLASNQSDGDLWVENPVSWSVLYEAQISSRLAPAESGPAGLPDCRTAGLPDWTSRAGPQVPRIICDAKEPSYDGTERSHA